MRTQGPQRSRRRGVASGGMTFKNFFKSSHPLSFVRKQFKKPVGGGCQVREIDKNTESIRVYRGGSPSKHAFIATDFASESLAPRTSSLPLCYIDR